MNSPPSQSPDTRASKARIIVAEDDFEMRRLVGDCLRKEGHEVHEVSNGAELLQRIEDSLLLRLTPARIDLVVTDVRMPVYTGIELVRGMREVGLETPVVIMTAFGTLETRKQAGALGATLLDKPFKLDDLRVLVKRLLRQPSQEPLAGYRSAGGTT